MSIWIFGYGSLMWDLSWQATHGCMRAEIAEVQGFRRVFNAPCTAHRGTPDQPGTVLNLAVDANSITTGLAMEFPDIMADRVLADLAAREAGYTQLKKMARLYPSAQTIQAHVYIYERDDVFKTSCYDQLASIAINARGQRGSCRDYVTNIALELERLGIQDSEVTRVYQAMQRQLA